MWLEKIILNKAEKKLTPYRERAELVKQEQSDQYQKYLPQITALSTKTTHWHGTGRYHYKHQEESRYKEVRTDTTTDILSSILDSNGLRPHIDPWIDSGGETVSLATTRMHAKAFARIHAVNEGSFLFELGSVKYWLRLYFILLFVWLVTNLWRHRHFIRTTFRTSFSKDIQNWAGAIRKPHKKKGVSIFDIFKNDIPTSDIEGNYPILIGLAANATHLIDTIPLTHKVEQRSMKPMTLDTFTHLEVPLKNVSETENILKQHGVSLPVIPIEFGDIYVADIPLQKLAFS